MTPGSPGSSVSPLTRNFFCYESDRSRDLDAGGDVSSVVQTPLEGGQRDGSSTNTLNPSFMSTGYERGKCGVHQRSHRVYPNVMRAKFHARKPIDRVPFVRDCQIPAHRIRAQENVVPLVSGAGCSGSPLTGVRIADGFQNQPELSGGLPAHEAVAPYAVPFNMMDGILGANGPTAKITIQPHAFHPYVAIPMAHVNCLKVVAEPAVVEPQNDHLPPSLKAILMSLEKHQRYVLDLGKKLLDPLNAELDWCDRMYAELELLNLSRGSSSGPRPIGDNVSGNTSALCNAGSTSVIGDNMQQSPHWESKNTLISEGASMVLKSNNGPSEVLELRGRVEKKRLYKHPEATLQVLVEWFNCHYSWPYPSKPQKDDLAERSGLTIKQASTWFANQRRRHWELKATDARRLDRTSLTMATYLDLM